MYFPHQNSKWPPYVCIPVIPAQTFDLQRPAVCVQCEHERSCLSAPNNPEMLMYRCTKNTPKYTCPKCAVPYCSVECYTVSVQFRMRERRHTTFLGRLTPASVSKVSQSLWWRSTQLSRSQRKKTAFGLSRRWSDHMNLLPKANLESRTTLPRHLLTTLLRLEKSS